MGRRSSRPQHRPSEQHRVGRRIRAREVRVIDHLGEQRGILQTSEALNLAVEAGLQLVEVNPKANPPVCKVMDYGKFKYETAKRERETKKNTKTQELKEVKFRPKTHGHDFDFKLVHVRRFLGDGDKVKLVVQFRGREITHPETGRAILDRVIEGCADLATVLQMASMEGNRMNMVLAPKAKREPAPRRPSAPRPPRDANAAPHPAAVAAAKVKAEAKAKAEAEAAANPGSAPAVANADAPAAAKPDAPAVANADAPAVANADAPAAAKPDAPGAKPDAPAAAKPDAPVAAKPDAPAAAKPDAPAAAKPDAPAAAKPAASAESAPPADSAATDA